jgi:phosphonate transport system substrate-binding protein
MGHSVGVLLRVLFPPSLGKAKASARAELVSNALGNELDAEVSIEVASSYGDLERRALASEAHIVWAPTSVTARLESTARAIFKVVRHGLSTYRSALVARRSDRLTMERLSGTRAAWVDPLSFGGYLLVADHLRRRGLDPDRLFASQTFHGSHPAALQAVADGKADVAAMTISGATETDVEQALVMHAGKYADILSLVTLTDEVPTDAIVVTSKLPPGRADLVVERLFGGGTRRSRPPTFLLAAMEADAFVRASPDEYAPVLRLLK